MKKFKISNLRCFAGIVMSFTVVFVAFIYFYSEPTALAVSVEENQPIYNGNRKSNRVALMFNCYEGKEIIYEIANLLNENNYCATFFFGGCFADDNFELIEYLIECGHEIANHGYFHKEQGNLNYESNLQEIQSTHNVILARTGVSMNLFAPPSGSFSKNTLKACNELGYKVILWSVDTIDWRDKNEKIVYNRATQNVSGGDFVLMHPKEHTLKALPEIIKYYSEKGLTVTTVSKCMENNG